MVGTVVLIVVLVVANVWLFSMMATAKDADERARRLFAGNREPEDVA